MGLAPLFVLAAANVGGSAVLWENAHWTISAAAAFAIATVGARNATGGTRHLRVLAALGLASYLGGSILWDLQVAAGIFPVPAPSDILFLGACAPIAVALLTHARAFLTRGELAALALDGAAVVLGVATTVLSVYEPIATGASPGLGLVLLAYPTLFLGLAACAVLAAASVGELDRVGGPLLIAAGLVITGLAWVVWVSSALVAAPPAGTLLNSMSSVAILVVAVGAATWELKVEQPHAGASLGATVQAALPVFAAILAATFIVAHSDGSAADGWRLVDVSAWGVIALVIARQTLLLRERTGFLAAERKAVELERTLRADAQRALEAESASERQYRTVVSVFARLGEQLTFAAEEAHMLAAGATAVRALFADADGEIQLLNASRDRLVIACAWGSAPRAAGTVPDVDTPLACFGLRRGAPYVVSDVTDAFSVGCPAMPASSGAVACVPMISSGQHIGVIHVTRDEVLTDDEQEHAVRTAEQLALAIANARLLRTMENLALTDPLTGLYNARFFDPYLERELAAAEREREPLGLVMIDLDRFKAFNDTYGHPAGDEALRTFARVAQGSIRRSDTLARYGGEEFVLLVRDADVDATAKVAETVRKAIEEAVVDLGAGGVGRLTASFGVADSARHGGDRPRLLRCADRALYQAKQAGRNRVVIAET